MSIDHDGRSYDVTVENLDVSRCGKCGAIMIDDDADDRLSDRLRIVAGLLSPSEIRDGREGLDMTQVEMAGYLKVSPSTLSRWERGGQIQQRAMDVLLRAF